MPRDVPRETQRLTAVLAAVLLVLGGLPARAADADLVARGAYLANAADCETCHTDKEHHGQPYAGGRALATPFGTFYSPNITPDPETGIGSWSDDEIKRSLVDVYRRAGAFNGGNAVPRQQRAQHHGVLVGDRSAKLRQHARRKAKSGARRPPRHGETADGPLVLSVEVVLSGLFRQADDRIGVDFDQASGLSDATAFAEVLKHRTGLLI